MPSNEVSAGLLIFRKREGEVEVFLAHPGDPFFGQKDAGVWTVPKGRAEAAEDLFVTAQQMRLVYDKYRESRDNICGTQDGHPWNFPTAFPILWTPLSLMKLLKKNARYGYRSFRWGGLLLHGANTEANTVPENTRDDVG